MTEIRALASGLTLTPAIIAYCPLFADNRRRISEQLPVRHFKVLAKCEIRDFCQKQNKRFL